MRGLSITFLVLVLCLCLVSAQTLPAFPDMSIGSFSSAVELFHKAVDAWATRSYNPSSSPAHAQTLGFSLIGVARFLQATKTSIFPIGRYLRTPSWSTPEDERDRLVSQAIKKVSLLKTAFQRADVQADNVIYISGVPTQFAGFIKGSAWDAFNDTSVNSALTVYAYETGLVALGLTEFLTYLKGNVFHDQSDVGWMMNFADNVVRPWLNLMSNKTAYSYFWYSTRTADAGKLVHNTNAMIATAMWRLGYLQNEPGLRGVAEKAFKSLRDNLHLTSSAYRWNYADDGVPVLRPDDVGHVSYTIPFMAFASERFNTLWTNTDSRYLSKTLREVLWNGNPCLSPPFIDGSGTPNWGETIGQLGSAYALIGGAGGGDRALFDYARSILYSNDLTKGTVGTPSAFSISDIGSLFLHRPVYFNPDSKWSIVAGYRRPSTTVGYDDMNHNSSGSIRFYTVSWTEPTQITYGGISLMARTSTARAKFFVMLPDGTSRANVPRVVVSLVYSSLVPNAVIWQLNETIPINDVVVSPLPVSVSQAGQQVWVRTSFILNSLIAGDRDASAGFAIQFSVPTGISIHKIEATPCGAG